MINRFTTLETKFYGVFTRSQQARVSAFVVASQKRKREPFGSVRNTQELCLRYFYFLLFTFYFCMFVLITYDVATSSKGGARRLRRIAQACKDYGQRVQNSVFECLIEQKHWVMLRERLLREMNTQEDSLRFYFLDADCSIEHHGCKQPVDFEEPLIL
jgi:CRISPR-associated protein Cas2